VLCPCVDRLGRAYAYQVTDSRGARALRSHRLLFGGPVPLR
jgi:hypothetical protein